MTADVLYPVAYDDDGHLVHITTAAKGAAAYCFGCDVAMIQHWGPQRQRHFHHRARSRCDPDRALHMAAVAAMAGGIDSAIRTGRPYLLERGCLRRGRLIERDIATPGATVRAERMLLRRDGIDPRRRTLPDVAVYAADGTTTVIEVVVSHDLDDKTREVYEQAGILVYRVYPDWQNLPELQRAASARDMLNMPSPWCTDCRHRAEQAAKQEAEFAERNLIARLVSESRPLLQRGIPDRVLRDVHRDIEPGDCVIGIFTGVDVPGGPKVPPMAAPRWNFKDPATGVGICVAIWPGKLRAEEHRRLLGQKCILTCWQEGTSSTGNRNFRFKLEAMPSAAA